MARPCTPIEVNDMSKKKAGKFVTRKKKNHRGPASALVIILLMIGLAAAILLGIDRRGTEPSGTKDILTESYTPETSEEALSGDTAPTQEQGVNLGNGLLVTDLGSYTGMYMEDGTDEIVSGVLMLVVENIGEKDIQYAEITMDFEGLQAQFALTTLPVGAKMVLLEKNRLQWDDTMDDGVVLPVADNVAFFQETISTMEDKLKIGIVDGAINVTNISGEDIPGIISVYYKNAAADIYYGGITYRIQIQGGLKADEIRQVMTQHASDTGSQIMFVTISQ